MSSSLFCDFPLYLAPMAGVSDKISGSSAKSAARMFSSLNSFRLRAFRRNDWTREHLDFDECERLN
jgi:hypothetical protein